MKDKTNAKKNAQEKVDRLQEVTRTWSMVSIMLAIDEEIQGATTAEEHLELLTFKSEILEYAVFGRVTNKQNLIEK